MCLSTPQWGMNKEVMCNMTSYIGFSRRRWLSHTLCSHPSSHQVNPRPPCWMNPSTLHSTWAFRQNQNDLNGLCKWTWKWERKCGNVRRNVKLWTVIDLFVMMMIIWEVWVPLLSCWQCLEHPVLSFLWHELTAHAMIVAASKASRFNCFGRRAGFLSLRNVL